MKTMLVPVDFSETADNAVRYAVAWSKTYDYKRIILLRSLYDSVFDSLVPSADYMHVSGDYKKREREEAKDNLNDLCRNFISGEAPDVKVSLAVSDEPLLRSILEVIESERPELVVIGSDNYSYTSDSYISGHVIDIARTSPAKVLIVPAHYRYQPVQQALVPVNFSAIDSLSKLESYQASSPLWKEKKLLVLNIDPKEKYLHRDAHFLQVENSLHKYLQNFQHEVFYSNHRDVISGILEFSKRHDVQMIVAMPGRYSFLYSLTHKSISEALYRNAKKPVLILK